MLFIGERKRSADKKDAYDFLERQLQEELHGLDRKDISDVVLAYEPVWAIGAKEAAPPDYIQDSLVFLRKYFSSRFGVDILEKQLIFYGGSVRLDNAEEILKIRGNDGISSGRGAMDPQYFIKMIKIASRIAENRR
jgi:triosephosphate isomerase